MVLCHAPGNRRERQGTHPVQRYIQGKAIFVPKEAESISNPLFRNLLSIEKSTAVTEGSGSWRDQSRQA
jgi:hypothetical protein